LIISQTIISTPPGLAECDEPDLAETGSERRSLLVGPLHHQMRLDRTLAALVPEFSRSYLQQLIEQDGVTLNGRPICKAALKVRVGDQLVIELRPTAQSQSFTPESMVLPMVYEDSYLRVINKPAGLVVHPAPGHWSGTLMNGLLGLDTLARELPRAGIVHRLDKDTSGLMVVARTREVMDALVRAIAAREVKRQYLALAHGQWQGPTELQVQAPVGRDPGNRLRMAVVDLAWHSGKPARTDIRCLDSNAMGCLVRCRLHTGRTHQIRVHMAALKHPLLADVLYGGSLQVGMLRQALHAEHLAFNHPVTGVPMSFDAPLPQDIGAAIDHWGLKYNHPTAAMLPSVSVR